MILIVSLILIQIPNFFLFSWKRKKMIPLSNVGRYYQPHRFPSALIFPNQYIMIGHIENPDGHIAKLRDSVKVQIRKDLLRYTLPVELIPRKYQNEYRQYQSGYHPCDVQSKKVNSHENSEYRDIALKVYAKRCQKYLLQEKLCYHLGNLSIFYLQNQKSSRKNKDKSVDLEYSSLPDSNDDKPQAIDSYNHLASSIAKEQINGPAVIVFWDDRGISPNDILNMVQVSNLINLSSWKQELVYWWDIIRSPYSSPIYTLNTTPQ